MNPFAFMPFAQPRTLNEEGIKAISTFKPNAKFVSPEYLGGKKLTVDEALKAFHMGFPIEPVFTYAIGFTK